MREIKPYPAPDQKNLIETMRSGKEISLSDIGDTHWRAHVNIVASDKNNVEGVVLWIPAIEPEDLDIFIAKGRKVAK